ncbi:hypothetical protein [Psychromonas arctica]|uniref:hypothetical protein n=1 Tax=Psychromonas arctica TaxID=168275 RepID=UPI002FD0A941
MAKLTNHATKRSQQRGIDSDVIELLIMLGTDVENDNEADTIAFSKRDKKSLLKTLKRCVQAVEKAPYIVLSHSGDVLTTAHKYN